MANDTFTFEEAAPPETFAFEDAAPIDPEAIARERKEAQILSEGQAPLVSPPRGVIGPMPGREATTPFKLGDYTITPGQEGPAIPYVRAPEEAGPVEKSAAGLFNVAAGIPNFMLSLPGIATAAAPAALPAKLIAPALRYGFGAVMAKATIEAVDKALQTKDPQDIAEAIGAGGFTALIARSRSDPELQSEILRQQRLRQPSVLPERLGLGYAPQTRIVSPVGIGEHIGVPSRPNVPPYATEVRQEAGRPAGDRGGVERATPVQAAPGDTEKGPARVLLGETVPAELIRPKSSKERMAELKAQGHSTESAANTIKAENNARLARAREMLNEGDVIERTSRVYKLDRDGNIVRDANGAPIMEDHIARGTVEINNGRKVVSGQLIGGLEADSGAPFGFEPGDRIVRKTKQPRSPGPARAILNPEIEKLSKLLSDPNARPVNADSHRAGLASRSVEDLNQLANLRDQYVAEQKAMEKKVEAATGEEKINLLTQKLGVDQRVQLLRESIEVATNSGSWVEGAGSGLGNLGPRPLDWSKNPEVADWLKANAQRLSITLPEALKAKPPEPEKIIAAAYQPEPGRTETGPHHPGILKRLGVPGFESRESRNTPQFGFQTNKRDFITREEASRLAKESGQDLEPFSAGEPVHSDQVSSPTDPTKPLGETKKLTEEETRDLVARAMNIVRTNKALSAADRAAIAAAIEPARTGSPEKLQDLVRRLEAPQEAPSDITGREGANKRKINSETERFGPDIISWLVDNMRLLSKSAARKQWTKEKFSGSTAQWHGAPSGLSAPHHNVIYSSKGFSPAEVAERAFKEGKIRDATPDALWEKIKEDSAKRAGNVRTEGRQAKLIAEAGPQLERWQAATGARRDTHPIELTTEELKPGDTIEVEGEQIKVTARDPDSGELTLVNGDRFGTQTLAEGDRIHVAKHTEGTPAGEGEFLPEETRDPWTVTKEEFAKNPVSIKGSDVLATHDWMREKLGPTKPFQEAYGPAGSPEFRHAEQVANALRQGKEVPSEVLQEYSEFLPKKPTPPPAVPMRPLTKAEQVEFQQLSLKARAAREEGGPQLTTEETKRYEHLTALAGQQELLGEDAASGIRSRIKTLRAKADEMDRLRVLTQKRAYASKARREELLTEARQYATEAAKAREEADRLDFELKNKPRGPARPGELLNYTEIGSGGEAAAGIAAHGTESGLPPGVPDNGPKFPSELLEASRRLGTVVRTRATLKAGVLGQYSYRKQAGVKMSDKIEVGSLHNQNTVAHEMGHDLDQLLWPQVELAYTVGSFDARTGIAGTAKAVKAELVKVSELMRGPIQGSKGYKAYRNRAAELIADYFALYAHDPARARTMAPKWSRAFEAALDRDPETKETIRQLHAGDVKPVAPSTLLGPVGAAAGMPGKVPPRIEAPPIQHDQNVFIAAAQAVKGLVRHWSSKVIGAQINADKLRKILPKQEDRNDAGAFIEGTGNLEKPGDTIGDVKARMTPAKERFIKDFRLLIEDVRGEINQYLKGITEGEYLSFLQDYLPHFYANSKTPAGQQAVARFLKNSPNAQQRKIPTLQEAHEYGLIPITQDPAVLYEVHSRINWRVAVNRMLLGVLKDMKTTSGEAVLLPWGKSPPGYIRSDNPLIQRVYAHQTPGGAMLWKGGAGIHPDAWMAVRQMLEMPTSSRLASAYDAVNSITRANAFAFSLFHDTTLRFASTGAQWSWYNPFRGLFRVFERNPLTGELEIFHRTAAIGRELLNDVEAATDAARHGLVFSWGDSESYQMAARDYLDKAAARWRNNPIMRNPTRLARDLQHWRQKNLWRNTHDALKIASYQDMTSKALADAPPGTNPSMVKEQIASMLNDAFGGQEWQTKFWLSPQNRRMLARFFLAPDWTFSTLRSVPFVSDAMSITRGNAPRIIGREPVPTTQEGLGGNLGRLRFWGGELAALATATVAAQYAIYQAFGDKSKGDNPWVWENEYGQGRRIDVTPIMRKLPWKAEGDPTRYYVNLGKRPEEILGYFTHLDQTLMSKAARPVAEVFRQVTGTEGDFKAQWKRDHETFLESLPERGLKAGSQFLPFVFSGNQFALSFPYRKGMTKYKAQQAYETTYELLANPGMFPQARAWLRGVPAPEGTLREMVDKITDAAERNGVPSEEIRKRALSTIRGKYYDQYFKAFNKNDEAKAEKAAIALENLGATPTQMQQSLKRRLALEPVLR